MTLASDISTTSTALSDIKQAIIAKGVTPSGNITTYATAISQISGGSSPVISSLSITPTTSAQTITAPSGTDGYSPITVSAVTSSIDANITAGNIKNGVSILGVTGNYSGTTPTGTLSITANGTYDVTNYASANVSVAGSSTIQTTPKANFAIMEDGSVSGIWIPTGEVDSDGNLIYEPFVDNWEDAEGHVLMYLGYLESQGYVDYENYGEFNIAHLSLANITTISSSFDSRFVGYEKPTVQTIDLSGLQVIEGSNYDFLYLLSDGQVNLTDIYFNSLNSNSFVDFNAIDDYEVFSSMFINTGTQVVHTAHFPSNLEPIISQFAGYPLFGGTQGYVNIAFDLPATT